MDIRCNRLMKEGAELRESHARLAGEEMAKMNAKLDEYLREMGRVAEDIFAAADTDNNGEDADVRAVVNLGEEEEVECEHSTSLPKDGHPSKKKRKDLNKRQRRRDKKRLERQGQAAIERNGDSRKDIKWLVAWGLLLVFASIFASGFDIIDDHPFERIALEEFYDSTNGVEWINSANWTDPYKSYCSWYGVRCDVNNTAVQLNLRSNGLSGRLNGSIANLSSLEILDLSDNDIKGTLSTEIGSLSKLRHLRLSYNSFIGTAPTELEKLQHLELIQLHGNRISGTIPDIINMASTETHGHYEYYSSFVADCGNTSNFEESLICNECTMCCKYDTLKSHLNIIPLFSLTILSLFQATPMEIAVQMKTTFEMLGPFA